MSLVWFSHCFDTDPKKHMKRIQHEFNEKAVARNKTPKLWETEHFNNFNILCFLQRGRGAFMGLRNLSSPGSAMPWQLFP
eukprot:3929144-Amphidinium_carterae.1